jgi:hypothetical protein
VKALLIGLIVMATPATAGISLIDLQERQQQSLRNQQHIKACTKIQNEYGKWAHARRVQIERVSTDYPGGFIEAPAVQDSYYVFADAFELVRTEIQAIQRRVRPDARECQVISDSTKDRLRRYLEDLISQ